MESNDDLPDPLRPNWLWLVIQFFLQVIFIIWLRYRVRGLRNFPPAGGGLVVVNHQSVLDPLLVQLGMHRPVSWVGRENLLRIPVIGWILKNTYTIGINRDSAATATIRDGIRRMQHGFLFGIYPEGTRTQDGSVGEFKPGFVAMIRRSKLPVYPVGIAGAYEAIPRGAWFLRPKPVRVVIGKPLTVEELAPYCSKGRERDLVELTRERVIACKEEAEAWLHGRETC